ncbi:MAG: hypothetical protein HC809_15395 [Gammaproteobacteria bacterium]|nr:hypothetical protein [Gammaproteobacteria bacterium]
MIASARSNAERALVTDPTQVVARVAMGVLVAAIDLDWQQGHQLIRVGLDDPRLGALAARLLRLYGEGTVPTDEATACDEVAAARTRGFIRSPPPPSGSRG